MRCGFSIPANLQAAWEPYPALRRASGNQNIACRPPKVDYSFTKKPSVS